MQEEEERELQEAMEATGMSIYPDEYEHLGYGRDRMMSVGNISAPPVFNRGYRLSSIGELLSIFAPINVILIRAKLFQAALEASAAEVGHTAVC